MFAVYCRKLIVGAIVDTGAFRWSIELSNNKAYYNLIPPGGSITVANYIWVRINLTNVDFAPSRFIAQVGS